MSVNKVILIGNVGVDPEIRYIDTRPLASFSLATTDAAYTTASGAQIPERTEWHRIVMWDRNADIEGKLRTRTWEDRAAIKRSVTEIMVERFEILSRQ